jgi:hypothetical protein
LPAIPRHHRIKFHLMATKADATGKRGQLIHLPAAGLATQNRRTDGAEV